MCVPTAHPVKVATSRILDGTAITPAVGFSNPHAGRLATGMSRIRSGYGAHHLKMSVTIPLLIPHLPEHQKSILRKGVGIRDAGIGTIALMMPEFIIDLDLRLDFRR